MTIAAKTSASNWLFLGTLVVLLSSVAPSAGQAGQNAVIKIGGGQANSVAFVDASKYESSSICQTIYDILAAYHTVNGIVIDARGFGSTLTCSGNPWSGSQPNSNVVLLPAATITISGTWTLPQNTRLIGEGPGATIIQASGFSSGGDMIDMGSATVCPGMPPDCPGVVIEHLTLNGAAIPNLNGIVNQFSEELSYVDDVALINIAGTGLTLGKDSSGGSAYNSGPYSNIYYFGAGTCARINGTGGTRGIHGLTCVTTSSTSGPLVYLDGANNSLEDVALTYQSSTNTPPGSSLDGIFVGSQTSFSGAQSNVLMNISGTNLTNVIHISSSTNSTSNCPPGTVTPSVCDLTILGVTGGTLNQVTIQDDLSGATITDASVGMYALGEQVVQGTGNSSIGNSRITTSPSVPSWLVGAVAPPTGSGTCATGAIYSCTGSGSACTNGTIWGCAGTAWTKIQ